MSTRLKIYAILRYSLIFIISSLLIFSIYTCSEDEENEPIRAKTAPAKFEIKLAPSGVVIEDITEIKLIVSGDGMETISTNLLLDKTTSKASGSVNVPLGDNRLFRIEVYAGNFLRYVGEQRSNVRDAISLQIAVNIKQAEGVGVIAVGEQTKGTGLVIAVGDVDVFLSKSAGNVRFIQNLAKLAGNSPQLKLDISNGSALTQAVINNLDNALKGGGFQTKIDESSDYNPNTYDAILFALPVSNFSSTQLSNIASFVNNGGMLILIADTEQPLEAINQIANQFGLKFDYSIVNIPGGNPGALLLTNLSTQPMFDGVTGIEVSYARSIEVSPSGGNNIKVFNSATPGTSAISTPDDPKLLIDPTQVNLGTILQSASVDIGNSGTGSVTWSIRESGIPTWLTVSPMSGRASSGGKQNVTIRVNRTGLAPNEYRHTLAVESNAGSGNLLVSMTVPEPDPSLSYTPRSISFGSTDTKKTFTIENNGGGTLNWRASNNQAWMKAEPVSGSLNSGQSVIVTLTISRDGLNAGNYNDIVSLTSNGGNGEVTVSMTVPEPPPSISVSPTSVDLGVSNTQGTFTIRNIGGGTLDWSATKQQAWLIINPTRGTLNGGQSASITLTVNRAGLNAGTYRDVVSLTSNGGNGSVSVSMIVPEPASKLAFTPTSIDFGTTKTSDSFAVSNEGGGTLEWRASKTQNWLTISMVSGSLASGASSTIALSVSRTGLAPGEYKDTISLTSNGGNGNLSITMTVPEPEPKLSFTPNSFDFGTSETQQSVTLTNEGGGTLTWQATKRQAWLTINPASGSIRAGASATINLIVNRANLNPGTYNDTISLTSNGGNGNIAVSMTIPEPAPSISLSETLFDFGVDDTLKILTITNKGGQTLEWRASKKEAWLTVLPVSGSLTMGKSATVTLTVNRFTVNLTPGTYKDVVAFTSNGGNEDVSVSMTIPEEAPELSYTPQSVDFGSTDTTKTFTLTNNGGGTIEWRASKTEAWLSISPTSGSLASGITATVTLTANRANLDPGLYQDVVSLTSNGGNGSINVIMTVPEPAPKLSFSPQSIDFGETNTQATITVTNSGGRTLTWSASKAESWLSISPASGSLTMGQSATITLNVNRTDLKSGAYKDTVALTSNGGNGNVSISMRVPEPPPELSFTPNSFDFGTSDTQKALTIRNIGGGTLTWRASKQQNWLTISPVNGSVASGQSVELSITVSRAGLAPNSYRDTISLTSDGGNGTATVTMTVQQTTPVLSFTPTSLDYGIEDTQKTFTITNSGGGTLTWQASRQQSWLTISPLVGSLTAGQSATITANVSRARLSPGDYKDSINITTNGGNGSISVAMKVPEPPPSLSFTPESLDFGSADTQKTFTITNSGGETLTWGSSTTQAWLSLSTASGSLALGRSANITVRANRADLNPGSYTGTIAITSNAGNGSISVALSVPGFSVTPTALEFGISDTSKTITVRNTGAGTLTWSASKQASWLSISPTNGSLNTGGTARITASVNRTGLNPANHTDTINFTSNAGSGSVTVSMPIPGLAYTPQALSFGSTDTEKTLTLTNSGGGTLNWQAVKRQNWLTLEPSSGTIEAGDSINISAKVSRANMASGSYADSIVVTSDGGNANVPVTMSVAGFLLSASTLDFGSTESQRLLNITNNGNGILEWKASKKEAWLTFEPTSGSVDAGRSVSITVRVSRTDLAPAEYTDNIEFTSNAGERRAIVKMSVPGLSFSPTALTFRAYNSSFNLSITNNGGGSLSWSASKTQPWLTISPTSGFVAAGATTTVAVRVSRTGIAPGLYEDTITLTTNAGNNTIPVKMEVAGLSYSPRSFDFIPSDDPKTLTITNTGVGELRWTADKKATWLTINPANGTVNGGESASITISVSADNLEPGSYTDNIALTSNGGNANIPVTLSMPELTIRPHSLIFADSGSKDFVISNTGGGNLIWNTTAKESWLKVSPANGTVSAGQSINVTVTVSRDGLAPGLYTDKIAVTSNGGNDNVDIFLSVAGLSVTPTSLTFSATETQKTLTINNTGAGTLAWQATDNRPWITLTPTSGSVEVNSPTSVTVTVSKIDLNPGEYTGTILFTSNGGNVAIPVTMIVANPTISVVPGALDFGETGTNRVFQIFNIGAGTLNWNIDTAKLPNWLSASPPSGSTVVDAPSTVTVNVSKRGLNSGTYNANIPITSNGGNAEVAVTMIVSDPVLSLSPTTLNFGTTLNELKFTIDNTGGGNLNWSIVQNLPVWLDVTYAAPAVGMLPDGTTVVDPTPQEIVVFVDRTRVAPGSYTHDISVLTNGGNGTVRVNMTVPPPTLRVSPTSLNFGQTATSRQLSIINDGGGVLSWTANTTVTSRQHWLFIEEIGVEEWDGISRAYSSSTINIVVHRDLAPGTYTGTIQIDSNGSPNKSATVNVTMVVPEPILFKE